MNRVKFDIPFMERIESLQDAWNCVSRHADCAEDVDYIPEFYSSLRTLPTSDLCLNFDPVTGDAVGFADVSISTDSNSTDMNRPITEWNASTIPFLPAGFSTVVKETAESDEYVESLNTGIGLMSFVDPAETLESLPPLPDLAEIKNVAEPASFYKQSQGVDRDDYACYDKWDVSQFENDVPEPAYVFPFQLDDFQKRAIYRLENNDHVFVSAPTSAGKTVIAQYGISLARSRKMKAIYTSPIKALSNQKYRDFNKTFGDTGIITGDVTLNPDASILIMTTEILRSMLYRGADILRDVDVVVFDECHYISDEERGVVWEESIILMPPHIKMVFLSATAPNDLVVAKWIGMTKQKKVWVERHLDRPVPLEHQVSIRGEEFFVLSSTKIPFDERKYKTVKDRIPPSNGKRQSKYPQAAKDGRFWNAFISNLREKDLLPAMIFIFSKKMCNELAASAISANLLTREEQNYVRRYCAKARLKLSPEDRYLPQIEEVFGYLERGIGIHHGGILTFLKEIVEILLADGLIKILFCTSTFAMGINVPSRTSVFLSLKKFNGKELVELTPSEYVQMAGRAGRRGLDEKGISICVEWDKIPSQQYLKSLFCSKVESLKSQFHLGDKMILSLMRTQGISIEEVLSKSLSTQSFTEQLPEMRRKMEADERRLNNGDKELECPNHTVAEIKEFMQLFQSAKEELRALHKRIGNKKIITTGSVVTLLKSNCIINVVVTGKTNMDSFKGVSSARETIEFQQSEVLCKSKDKYNGPTKIDRRSKTEIASFLSRDHKMVSISEVASVEKNKSKGFDGIYMKLVSHKVYKCASMNDHIKKSLELARTMTEFNTIKNQIESGGFNTADILKSRIDYLIEGGYITQERVLTMKGNIAAEMTTIDMTVGTELLFSNFFESMSPSDVTAFCSVFASERVGKNSDEELHAPERFAEKYKEIEEIVHDIFNRLTGNGVDVEDTFVDDMLNPVAMDAISIWSSGGSFTEAVKSSPYLAEGDFSRIIIKTAQILQSMERGAMSVGTPDLAELFSRAGESIKKGIVFLPSLYFD